MKRFASFLVLALVGCGTREKAPAPGSLALVRGSDRALGHFGVKHLGPAILDVVLPTRADGVLLVKPRGDEDRAISVRPLDVAPSAPRSMEAATSFADVAPSTDLLYAHDGDRVEEVRVLRDARAPTTFRWKILGGRSVVDVRIREGVVEAIDAHGRVLVRSGKPFAVDRAGVHRELALRIARRGEAFVLTASLDARGLAYPVVVDPVWIGGPTMSVGRDGHVAALDPTGKVWIGCGSTPDWDVFDPATDTITAKPTPTNSIMSCAISFTGGKTVVAGDGAAMSYDPTTDAWTDKKASGTRTSGSAATLADGRILVAGGYDGTAVTSTAETYDPATDTWTTRASMATAREGAMIIRLASGKVLVAGGSGVSGALTSAEVWDPTADTWTTVAMPTARTRGAIARLPSGKVIVAGGFETDTDVTAVFDPTTSTFTAGPKLTTTRAEPAIAATLDGRVLVFGGSVMGESMLASVDLVDATVSTVTKAPSMTAERAAETATVLADGRILVTGGRSGSFSSLASTELFASFANGTACTWNGECASGACVDGVCCASACTSSCLRCDVPGKEGTCAAASATTGCGPSAACAVATLTPRGHCSGTDGTCVAATGATCAGGLVCADATSCLSSCTKDTDCTTSHCDTTTGLCLPPVVDAGTDTGSMEDAGSDTPAAAPVPEGPPKLLGSAKPCKSASECETGFCVDGVCCDSPCTETCHSCALPSAPGRCSEEPLGVDLRAECGPALSCSRTCGKGGQCTTSTKGTQCAPSVCTGPSSGKGAAYCVANGQPCPTDEQIPFDCGAYVCDPAFGACRTSCTSSDACASGFVCDTTQKSCVAVPGEDSGGCAVSAPGLARGGAAFVLAALGLARVSRRRSRRG